MASEGLEAARRTGDLTKVMGALREQEQQEAAASGRAELDVVDAAIVVGSRMAGKPAAERRQALREVKPGATVTAEGETTRKPRPRVEQVAEAKQFLAGLTEEQRIEFATGDRLEKKSEYTRGIYEDAFAELATDETGWALDLETAINTEAVDLDLLPDDDEADGLDWAEPMPWEVRSDNNY